MLTDRINKFFDSQREVVNQLALPSCTHSWQLFAKNYAPPRKDVPEGISDKLAEKALLGVTTYLWSCSACSQVRKEETMGSDENQLADIFEKADKFGIQYIEDDGRVFAIARVPESEAKLPIR